MVKKLLITMVAGSSVALTSYGAALAAGQPDNFGQCRKSFRDYGIPQSSYAPGQTGQGPASIHYDQYGNQIKVNSAKAFQSGIACNYVPATSR
jgi:hypothetical protein